MSRSVSPRRCGFTFCALKFDIYGTNSDIYYILKKKSMFPDLKLYDLSNWTNFLMQVLEVVLSTLISNFMAIFNLSDKKFANRGKKYFYIKTTI